MILTLIWGWAPVLLLQTFPLWVTTPLLLYGTQGLIPHLFPQETHFGQPTCRHPGNPLYLWLIPRLFCPLTSTGVRWNQVVLGKEAPVFKSPHLRVPSTSSPVLGAGVIQR